jgi:hypothetical protein
MPAISPNPDPDVEVAAVASDVTPVVETTPEPSYGARFWCYAVRVVVVGLGILVGLIAAEIIGLFTGLVPIC